MCVDLLYIISTHTKIVAENLFVKKIFHIMVVHWFLSEGYAENVSNENDSIFVELRMFNN